MRKINYADLKFSYDDITEYLELMWVNTKVQANNFVEFLRVAMNYYSNFTFAKIDLFLLVSYLFQNPFGISKRFLQKKGEDNVYAYGETPLTTLDQISKECEISEKDTVFELGCGRGRTCFWLHSFIHCKVVGIEYIPEFIERANAVKTKFDVQNVEFRLQDFLQADFTGATTIYLYGTCLEENAIRQIISKCKSLPAGTKIITISYPLTDYTQEPLFEVMKRFQARYPWGTADVYLQIKKQ